MKKYLIVLAALAMLFVSCEKEGAKYTSISFKETELTLGVGYAEQLLLLYEPAKIKKAPQCVWVSSDTNVVVVDQTGVIEAIAIGEAIITATYGEGEDQLQAVCHVTTDDARNLLKWGGWSLWDLDKTTILSKDTLRVKLQRGDSVGCVMVPAEYRIWDENIFLNGNRLSGAGYTAYVEGTAWLITDALDSKGPNYYYLGTDELRIVDNIDFSDTAYACCALTGKFMDPDAHVAWLNDTTETLPAQYSGEVGIINFDASKYIDPICGLIGEGIFVGDEEATSYRNKVQWLQEPQMWGLQAYVENDTMKLVKPYAWAPIEYEREYLYVIPEEAPKYTAKEFIAPTQDIRKFTRSTNKKDVFIKR